LVAVVSAAFGVTGRNGVWATTVYVKLRITGLDEVVVVLVLVLVVVLDPVEPAVAPEVVDEPEVDDEDVEELEELEELLLDVDELPEPVVPVLVVDFEPAFLVVFALVVEPLASVPLVPLVPDAPPWALEPPAPEPPAWPAVPPVVPRPVPVVAPVPPTNPIRASTWQRTVALFALSIVPFSTTTISTSPESISTNRSGTCVFPHNFAGR
jgi:hypothetical protein